MRIKLIKILHKPIRPTAFVLAVIFAAAGLLIAPQKAAAASGAIWPTSGSVTGYYQWRCPGNDSNHWGFDIGNNAATVPVYATQDGTVYHRDDPSGYGTYIVVAHVNGYKSLYGHLSSRAAGNGQFVRQGELIGYMGNTGSSTGKHLHFEVRDNASYSSNLDGTPKNFNSAAGCGAGIGAKSQINYNFPNLVSSTAQTSLANVNSCGALYIKRTYWGNWEQHMGCGQATRTALSPNGNTIAAIRPDGMMIAKDGYWAGWVEQFAGAKDVALGNNGYIAVVDNCGAVYAKRSFHGGWENHMGCGQAKGVSMSGDGNTILVTRPDNTLVGKNSYWGSWVTHSGVGDSQDSAVSSNGTIASVNGCGALYVKRSYWGAWEQHMGCGQAKEVAVSPNGEGFAVVRPDNTLIAKQSYWGNWEQHVGTGDTRSAAIANP